MTKSLRLALMGTPIFSVSAFAALAAAGHEIACVYTQPPRPAGRGHLLNQSAVHQWAAAHDIPIRHPKSLKSVEAQAEFAALGLDAAVVVAYGLILPAAILTAPQLGCLNIHASLLPRWRGAAPIHRALLAGDSETGITIMQMDQGLDTGPMLSRITTPIADNETAQSLHDRLAILGADLIVSTLAARAANNVTPTTQPEHGVTYAHKLSRDDSPIDWYHPAAQIVRQIRALTPWPGCFFIWGDETIKILAATVTTNSDAPPGTIIDREGRIACGDGTSLLLEKVQRPSRPAISGRDLVNGMHWEPGLCLTI